MDKKEIKKKELQILRKTSLPAKVDTAKVKGSLERILQEKTGELREVVSILVYDKGRMSVNNYLTQLDEKTIFGRFNLSTQHRIHYPSRLPDEETYHRGYFIPASLFRLRNGQPMPKDAYVAIGRSFPMQFDAEQMIISYTIPQKKEE